MVQLDFSQTAFLPFVKASSFGLSGLERDLVLVTSSVHDGNAVFKAEIEVPDEFDHIVGRTLNNVVKGLEFITNFDFSLCKFLQSGHLEQLAIACPHLQSLNLDNNQECLRSLKGLLKIAQYCSDLRGLNLLFIPLRSVENHIQLWETLSDMKNLTYLALETCLFGVCATTNVQHVYKLFDLFQKCSRLQALQFWYSFEPCFECLACHSQIRLVWALLSYFPVLRHCRYSSDDPDSVQDIITSCKELTCLSCHRNERLSLSSVGNSNLQQLSILSDDTDIPDVFLETVSAHGGLVHVAFAVNSVTIEGIASLIENSHELQTLVVFTHQSLCNKQGLKVNLKEFKTRMKRKFTYRKLFTVGSFKLTQNNESVIYHLNDYLPNSDLSSLWL